MSDFNVFQKGTPLPQSSYSLLIVIYAHRSIGKPFHP